MIHLKQILDAAQYQITSSSAYLFKSYGPHARFLDFQVGDDSESSVSTVFDTQTQRVYEISLYADNLAYRWIDPEYLKACQDECKQRQIDFKNAYDEVHFTDCEVEEDILDKVTSLFNNGTFDHRVQVPLNLSDEHILQLALLAHEHDITLNQMAEKILWEAVHRAESSAASIQIQDKVKKTKKRKK